MTRWPAALGVAAASVGGLVLLGCGRCGLERWWVPSVFALSLGAEGVSAVALLWRGRWLQAGVALIAAVVLLALSLLPVYVEHWTPWDDESHRHTLWELGHVH